MSEDKSFLINKIFSSLFNSKKRTQLEALLEESYKDQLKRHDLMKEFLISKVYVKGMKKGNELFLDYSKDFLLMFTTESALVRAKEDFKKYIFCEVKLILRMIPKGIRLLLNTGPNYGKEFVSDEISFLKDGKIPPDIIHRQDLKATERFAIYSPKIYPQKLIDVLFEKMKHCPSVERAYLAEIFREDSELPNLIIGIKVSDPQNFPKEISEIADAVVGTLPNGEYVDFIELKETQKSPVTDFMLNKTKPFFDKQYL